MGVLIFLIQIYDIDRDLDKSVARSFADDTRCTRNVRNVRDVSDHQKETNTIYDWTSESNMELNDAKFEVLRYGLDDTLKICTSYITPNGQVITQKESLRDLGVTMSDNCSFDIHMANSVEKCKKMISWILRTFKTRKKEHMLLFWKMYLLPLIEYCSVLWSPSKASSIQKLDAVQWSFLRKIKLESAANYWQVLKHCNIYSLQRRRERYRILYVWKILEGLVPNVNESIRPNTHIRHGRKCSVIRIYNNSKIQSIVENSFCVNGPRLFNILPRQVRDLTGIPLNTFKKALDDYLKLIPDEPQLVGYTAMRRADSNSLVDMIKHIRRDGH